MSNTLAIAAVTSTLRHILERALTARHPGPVGGASVRTLRLDQLSHGELAGSPGLNLMLYQTTPNHAGNLTDLSTRDASGALLKRPNAAIDLHYLVTAFGDEASLEGQRLMARALVALAATPVLTRDTIAAARAAHSPLPDLEFLADADLDAQVELVKLSPLPLTLEDHTRIWGLFQDAPFQLSAAYRATVVLLEADVATRRPLPVRTRVLGVQAGMGPVLTAIEAVDPGEAVTVGSGIALRGSGLLRGSADTTLVRIGRAALTPDPGSTPEGLLVTLDDGVAAGIHGVRVEHVRPSPGPGGPPERIVGVSAAQPLTVYPTVAVEDVTADDVVLRLHPPLTPAQRALVRLDPTAGGPPLSLGVDPVPADGAPRPTLTLDRSGLPDGDYLVRVEVDGIASIPDRTGDLYTGPLLELD